MFHAQSFFFDFVLLPFQFHMHAHVLYHYLVSVLVMKKQADSYCFEMLSLTLYFTHLSLITFVHRSSFDRFATALIDHGIDSWVMNVVPVSGPNTLPVIYDRGLIGVNHDW